MPSAPDRRRFFATRGAIAKRQTTEAARVFAAPPAGRFQLRLTDIPGVTIGHRPDGVMTVSNARLLLADGSEIDGATVQIHDDVADAVLDQIRTTALDVEGVAVVIDDGYCLVTHDQVEMRAAA